MESDEGQYRCVAVNLAGTSSATVGLNVISEYKHTCKLVSPFHL